MIKPLSTLRLTVVSSLAVAAATAVAIPATGVDAIGTGAVSLTTSGVAVVETFDTLAPSGTSDVLPNGWYVEETGTNANALYAAGTGSATAGDSYSFGAAASTERALGGLLSGSLNPTLGAQFVNNTGGTITSLDVAYTGEMWRAGVTNRNAADRLDVQFSTDATTLLLGTWADVDALDVASPNINATSGALDGNAAANRSAIAGTIPSLAIPNGATFWIRWTDFNISGSDDGLAIDDISITPTSEVVVEDTAPAVTATVPADGATLPNGADLTVTFSEPVAVADPWFTLTCSVSDTSAATSSGGPTTFTIDPGVTLQAGETCTLTVLAGGVTDQDADDPPDNPAADVVIGFTAVDICSEFTSIPAIQGAGAAAAITGNVSTKGVVVGDFEGTAAGSGFYLQDLTGDGDPATSDGIFVFTGAADLVSAGQVVRVTGFARERFNQTVLNGSNSNSAAVTAVNIVPCGTGSVAATDVTLPVPAATDFERYEGMLVRFPQPLVIAEYFNYDRFGEIVLAQPLPGESRPFTPTTIDEPGAPALARADLNARSRITLDDVQSAQNPPTLRHPNGQPFSLTNTFRGGDTVTDTTGVLGFDFSVYRVFPTAPANYAAVNQRPAAPEPIDGDLRVAAMNTLNYFLTPDYPNITPPNPLDNACGPTGGFECRGADADQPDELARQRAKLLAALSGLDAAVIGLNELENTTGVEPLADIVAGLPGYAYIDTGTIGTDAIKVGLLYRPAEVTPVGDFRVLDSSIDPRFIDTKSRPALAQTFVHLATGGKFTVVVNHLKSKGSACDDIGDADAGDGQGNCNGTRELAAQALADWIATDPTGSGDPDFLIIGDLNSYAQEDPIDAIKAGADDAPGTADDFTNLIAQFQGTFAYSYTFDGQAGYLDHALASAAMVGQVKGATDWHINSDEPDILDYDTSFKPPAQDALFEPNASRASDHDPVIVGIDPVNSSPTADAGGPYSVVEGEAVMLTATGADPEQSALTFEWDLDGDGTYETAGESVAFTPAAAAPTVLTVTVRVTDAFGNAATDTATVAVLYDFGGFFQPVDNAPVVNTVRAGRAVPVRFSLDGFHGFNIFASGSPSVVFVPCGAGPTDAIEIAFDVPGSFLLYNPFTDNYIYTWKTNRAWRGTCGELRLTFRDGTTQTALFSFTR